MNPHLDNKLIRIRHKMKYGALLTNDRLHEWGLTKDKNCSFCGKFPEDIDHLLSGCEILSPLWEKARNITQQKWKVSQNILDKKIGIRLVCKGERKTEKLFLKIMWQLWGIKHKVENHAERKEGVEKISERIEFYAEIMNFDTGD